MSELRKYNSEFFHYRTFRYDAFGRLDARLVSLEDPDVLLVLLPHEVDMEMEHATVLYRRAEAVTNRVAINEPERAAMFQASLNQYQDRLRAIQEGIFIARREAQAAIETAYGNPHYVEDRAALAPIDNLHPQGSMRAQIGDMDGDNGAERSAAANNEYVQPLNDNGNGAGVYPTQHVDVSSQENANMGTNEMAAAIEEIWRQPIERYVFPNCQHCGQGNHHIIRCEAFLKMPLELRQARIGRLGLCPNCFRRHRGNCKIMGCPRCHRGHNSLLCPKLASK